MPLVVVSNTSLTRSCFPDIKVKVGFVSCECNFALSVTFKWVTGYLASVTGYLASFSLGSCKVHLDPFVVSCDSEFTPASDLINIICQFINTPRSIKYRRPKEAEIEGQVHKAGLR